jgi:hypothetical protein
MLRSWLPPDARDRHALGTAAPHRRCRLFGYRQMPDATTPLPPRLGTVEMLPFGYQQTPDGAMPPWLPPSKTLN